MQDSEFPSEENLKKLMVGAGGSLKSKFRLEYRCDLIPSSVISANALACQRGWCALRTQRATEQSTKHLSQDLVQLVWHWAASGWRT